MDEGEAEQGAGGGADPELIRSYIRFARRALRAHRLVSAVIVVVGLVGTVLAFRYLPRTFECSTVLLVDSSQVLEGNGSTANGLVAAESLIMRHDNLESIVRDTGLIKKFEARRPPLLAFKDRLITKLVGELSDETKMASLVGTLEAKLAVKVANGTLTITVDWTDGQTAAEIAEAARESFVKTRHVAEMSAFEEKLTILDGHTASLRDEIETEAKQARGLLEERAKNLRAAKAANGAAELEATGLPHARASGGAIADLEGPRLKEELDAKRKKLADYDRDHDQRVQDERRKLEELKLKLTPSHPEVITEERRLATLEQEPSDISLLRSEVQSMDGELKQREILGKRGGTIGGGATRTAAGTDTAIDPLPGDIFQLLDVGQIDPALAAQLSSAISKYAALRDDIRTGRIQFDTAQAAFNFRYRVVVPAEAPKHPAKPKAAVVLGGGIAASLVLALLLPLLLELKTGIIVERWQVAAMQVPVLADLRLPPTGGERDSEAPRAPG